MWRGGKAKGRSVPALPETERLKMGALIPCSFSTMYFTIYVTRSPQRPLMGIYKWSQRSLDFPIEIVALCNCSVLKERFFSAPACKKLLEGCVVYYNGDVVVI